tara:strand:+ start:595 stop:741 length:147 start_codon:yes stop_codon:yes gene_type:complete
MIFRMFINNTNFNRFQGFLLPSKKPKIIKFIKVAGAPKILIVIYELAW